MLGRARPRARGPIPSAWTESPETSSWLEPASDYRPVGEERRSEGQEREEGQRGRQREHGRRKKSGKREREKGGRKRGAEKMAQWVKRLLHEHSACLQLGHGMCV